MDFEVTIKFGKDTKMQELEQKEINFFIEQIESTAELLNELAEVSSLELDAVINLTREKAQAIRAKKDAVRLSRLLGQSNVKSR